MGITGIRGIGGIRGISRQWALSKQDVNATAFLTAAGVTDTTQKKAINTLVIDLKAINTIQPNFVNFDTPASSVLKAIYPLVGISLGVNKFNLLDPRDLDAAYRLLQVGTVDYTNGMKSDGSTGYLNAKLNYNQFASNDLSFGLYRTENNVGGNKIMGYIGSNTIYMQHDTPNAVSQTITLNNVFGTNRLATIKQWTSLGWFIANMKNGTKIIIGDNKIVENTDYVTTQCASREAYLIAANNNGGPGFYDKDNIAFSFIGKGLLDTVYTPFKNAVNKYLKTLMRTKKVFYFYGDSITQYYNASPQTNRYSTVLTGMCSGFTEFSKAVAGQTIVDFYNRLTETAGNNNMVDYFNDPESLLFMGHGVNQPDMANVTVFENAIEFIHNTKKWPYSNMILTGPFINTSGDIPAQSAVNQAIKAMAEAKGILYCNVFDALNGTTGYVDTDQIHLTNAGHAFIANFIYTQLVAWGKI